MRATWGMFRAGLRHQASYRLAMVSGLATNVFFGVVRSAVFLSVYRQRDDVGGLSVEDALTYVWILQAVFSVTWAPWIHELPTRIRSGEWTAELTRPGSVLGRHIAYDMGRTSSLLLLRAPIPVFVGALVFDLRLPTGAPGVIALIVSLFLAAFSAVCIRFLIGSIAFWTPDFRGIYSLVLGPIYLMGGFVIPVEFFPESLRLIAVAGPFSALLRAPVAVAGGRDVFASIALQLVWAGILVVCAQLVLERATRRMVVFGG